MGHSQHRLASGAGGKFVSATGGQGEEHIAVLISNNFLIR